MQGKALASLMAIVLHGALVALLMGQFIWPADPPVPKQPSVIQAEMISAEQRRQVAERAAEAKARQVAAEQARKAKQAAEQKAQRIAEQKRRAEQQGREAEAAAKRAAAEQARKAKQAAEQLSLIHI